ncbi:vomeronasal type-2 receptor 1-like [Leptodactylus fuscus]
MENDAVVGFIGDFHSVTTLPMARLLGLYGYTQISYGARDPLLSNKRLYPNIFRTVPNDKIQFSAFVKLLERFQWTWVGIITSDDDSGRRELQQIIRQFTSHQICVEFTILVSTDSYKNVPKALQESSTDVIIICGTYSANYIKLLYNAAPVLNNKTLLLPSSWTFPAEISVYNEDKITGNCSLAFSTPRHNIAENKILYIIRFSEQPSDEILEDLWMLMSKCYTGNPLKDFLIPMFYRFPFRHCSEEEKKLNLRYDFSEDATPYHVYTAVYIMAQALHGLNVFLNNGKQNPLQISYYKSRWQNMEIAAAS